MRASPARRGVFLPRRGDARRPRSCALFEGCTAAASTAREAERVWYLEGGEEIRGGEGRVAVRHGVVLLRHKELVRAVLAVEGRRLALALQQRPVRLPSPSRVARSTRLSVVRVRTTPAGGGRPSARLNHDYKGAAVGKESASSAARG
eukprot:1193184-Prorocentrum_minimum.AAC.5